MHVYQVTEAAQKSWCGSCGTPLFNTNHKYPGMAMIYAGILTDHAALLPVVNVYCSSKLAWVDTLQSMKNFDGGSR